MKTQELAEDALRTYYHSNVWNGVTWRGYRCMKSPMDLWQYGEIIHECRPRRIIECGTADGGTALWMADCQKVNGIEPCVVTVDIKRYLPVPAFPDGSGAHKYYYSSLDGDFLEFLHEGDFLSTMVVLDSNHTAAHVYDEMEAYSTIVSSGQYMVVEDTIINGHPVLPDYGPGPMEAVGEFLRTHKGWTVDESMHKHGLTFNINGYLRKE